MSSRGALLARSVATVESWQGWPPPWNEKRETFCRSGKGGGVGRGGRGQGCHCLALRIHTGCSIQSEGREWVGGRERERETMPIDYHRFFPSLRCAERECRGGGGVSVITEKFDGNYT